MNFADVSSQDRGLAYGDGLFETVRLAAGRLAWWPEHLARLTVGCRVLGLSDPCDTDLRQSIDAAVLMSGKTDAVVKLIYTAGAGQRGYRRPDSVQPSLTVLVDNLPEVNPAWYAHGLVLGVLPVPFAGGMPTLTGLKHLNRLPQVMARTTWPTGVDECLLQDESGLILGGTQSNFCWLEGDCWFTPPIRGSAIAGTVRGVLNAHLGVKVVPLAVGRLALARAAVLTNAVWGVLHVGRIKGNLGGAWAGQMLELAPARQLATRWQVLSAAQDRPDAMPSWTQTAWVSTLQQEAFLTGVMI